MLRLPLGLLSALAFVAVLTSAAPLLLDLIIEPDPASVTAGSLEGTWEADPAVAERLGRKPKDERVVFEADPGIIDVIPDKYDEALGELRIYEAGTLKFLADDEVIFAGPYLLSELGGSPHVIVFRDRNGEALGDSESFYVFIAHAKDPKNDILFIGGDMPDEEFRPFRRVQD